MNLSGIDSKTLLEYPPPTAIPSAAYEKARAILQRAQQMTMSEKTAGEFDGFRVVGMSRGKLQLVGPSRMTPDGHLEMLLVDIDPKKSKKTKKTKTAEEKSKKRKLRVVPTAQQTKSFGGHVIGGAAGGRFLHDWIDSGRQTAGHTPLTSKTKFLAMSAGGGLGLAEYVRRRVKKHSQEKTMKKTSGVKDLLKRLIGKSTGVRAISREELERQIAKHGPGPHKPLRVKAQSLDPNLKPVRPWNPEDDKMKLMLEKSPRKMKTSGVGNLGAEEVAQTEKKILTRTETRAETELLFSGAASAKAKEQRKVKGLFHQADGAETEAPMLAKTASAPEVMTAAVDAFFTGPQPDMAQQLYPELLTVKSAAAPGGRGTSTTPIQTKGAVAKSDVRGPIGSSTTSLGAR